MVRSDSEMVGKHLSMYGRQMANNSEVESFRTFQ